MAQPLEPSKDDAYQLFADIDAAFPSATLGNDRWYLLTLATLVASPQVSHAATLYTYLTSRPEFQTPESRQRLIRRLREALVKLVSIIGVCKPLEAVWLIADVEREGDKDFSFSREHWQTGPKSLARGQAWLDTIYKENRAKTLGKLEAHKDFAWISSNITYGLYLSDHTILDGIETEIVVLCGIMIQNLPRQTGWHLRGMRRAGVSFEDTEKIHRCIEIAAQFASVRIDRVPRVAEIEHEF